MKLIFASSNKNKIAEIKQIIPEKIQLITLSELNSSDDIPETADTFEGNALIKAKFVATKWNKNAFADDSGLIVPSLNNAPGVYSARYAGTPKNDEANNKKLLNALKGIENRSAYFKTVIALIWENDIYYFEGIIEGKIIETAQGKSGFGYDPLFIPDGFDKTFAEMTIEEKNHLSHRAIAVKKLNEFLLLKIT